MADWDPAKYVVDSGGTYVHSDGRVEGGLHPPEYYKYPSDDELFGGTWEDGLQAIEDFDWGGTVQPNGENLTWEEGLEEIENFDWGQDSRVEEHRNTEAKAEITKCEPSTETPSQYVGVRSLHEDHKRDSSNPSIQSENTPQQAHDELPELPPMSEDDDAGFSCVQADLDADGEEDDKTETAALVVSHEVVKGLPSSVQHHELAPTNGQS